MPLSRPKPPTKLETEVEKILTKHSPLQLAQIRLHDAKISNSQQNNHKLFSAYSPLVIVGLDPTIHTF